MLDDIEVSNKQKAFGGDFNLISDCKLEINGGSPVLKKKSIAKLIKINESPNLCDICRIRRPPKKRYTFHQNQVSGFIQRKLDYFFVSNTIQDFVKKTDVFASFSTDHSPIFFSFEKGSGSLRGRELWKFNKSLISDSKYIQSVKKHICETSCL